LETLPRKQIRQEQALRAVRGLASTDVVPQPVCSVLQGREQAREDIG
jgi:hypothetical protein